jgi:hypothetical protein
MVCKYASTLSAFYRRIRLLGKAHLSWQMHILLLLEEQLNLAKYVRIYPVGELNYGRQFESKSPSVEHIAETAGRYTLEPERAAEYRQLNPSRRSMQVVR